MDAYEQVNASFGAVRPGHADRLDEGAQATDETNYNSIEDSITSLTGQRDALVAQIGSALNAAAFDGDQRSAS